MSDLQGQVGELRFTIEVKRGATGETETYEMVGTIGDAPEEKDED